MKPQKSRLPVAKIFNSTFEGFKKNPSLFLPFLIFSLVELISLFILFLAPRMPLKIFFGPIIKTFWGESFLHYPANFFLLPKLASFARMGLAILIGSLLTGMAVGMVSDFHANKRINLKNSFRLAFKNYVSLFIIVFIFTASFYFLTKILTILLIKYFTGHSRLLFLKADIWLGPIFTVLSFILAIFIQAIFVYAIPLLIIGKEKTFAAIIKSFVLFKKLFLPTVILITLPMLLFIPLTVISYNNTILMDKFFPEITLWVLALTTLVTSLAIDSVITVSTTLLYLEKER